MARLALIPDIVRVISEARVPTNVLGRGLATVVLSEWQGPLDREGLPRKLTTKGGIRAAGHAKSPVYTAMMSAPHLAVVTERLSIEALAARVEADARAIGEGCGALAAFVGVVRATHGDRRVRHLEYEAFVPLALKVFRQIADEVAGEWPGTVLGLVHRVGQLQIGDGSVAIVASAAHRAEAFAACRYAIERVKQIAPIWKHEFFEDGDAWVEGATADPADAGVRRQALERSCV